MIYVTLCTGRSNQNKDCQRNITHNFEIELSGYNHSNYLRNHSNLVCVNRKLLIVVNYTLRICFIITLTATQNSSFKFATESQNHINFNDS